MKTIAIFSALILGATSIFAQNPVRNTAERGGDHSQIKYDKTTLQRDIQELDAFRSKADLMLTAYNAGDKAKVQAFKTDLIADMKREIAQTENKMQQAKSEVHASGSEVRSDNREIRNDRHDLGNGNHRGEHDHADLNRDKINRADDIKDRHDDREDAEAIGKRLQNQRDLLAAMDTDAKAAIPAFIKTMENDLAAGRRELGEDKGELHEDRREGREDRRERRE